MFDIRRYAVAHTLVLLLVLPLMTLPMSGCGQQITNLVTGEPVRGGLTWQQEVALGRESHPQVVAFFGLYEEEPVTTYVRDLGQLVLEHSAWANPQVAPAEIRQTPFHFHVLDNEIPNAMALPGGYLYVTRGLLAFLENEAQLAVVLGHEIGHVLARHHSVRAHRAQLGQIGLIGAAILGGVVGGGQVAQGILDIGGAGVQLLFLSYSRDAEREADIAGVSYAEFAGYNAAEAASFFASLRRLGEREGSIPSFLSTHPDPAEREATIPQLAAEIQPRGTAVNRAQHLSRIANMVLGENPRHGYTEGNTFHHPEFRFRFSFPQGWRLTNSAAAVLMGEPNGRAVMEFTFAADQTSAQAAGLAFARTQGLRIAEQRATTVGGNPAYSVTGSAATQQGELGFVAYFIEHGGNVYRFMGLTAAAALGQYRNTFVSSINSFATETDPAVLGRQPVRLEVVSVTSPTPFRQLLQGRPIPPGMDIRMMAIMNEVELDEVIPAGRQVKLPRPG
jgi:predicted Zn-dependent protease